jgi:hypothetical protein
MGGGGEPKFRNRVTVNPRLASHFAEESMATGNHYFIEKMQRGNSQRGQRAPNMPADCSILNRSLKHMSGSSSLTISQTSSG